MTENGHSHVPARALLASAALALAGIGCSSNPLDGTWSTATTIGTLTVTETVDVESGGSLSVTWSGTSATCSGAWTTSGYQWAATPTEVTISGTPSCSGAITCGAVSINCSGDTGGVKAGSCTYALTDGNDTLALTACSGPSDVTFTRAN